MYTCVDPRGPQLFPPERALAGTPAAVSDKGLDLASIPEHGQIAGATSTVSKYPRHGKAPWSSPAVTDFASKLKPQNRQADDADLHAMTLQGPQGKLLQAVGEKADNQAAAQSVLEIQKQQQQSKGSQCPGGSQRRPPTPPRERKTTSKDLMKTSNTSQQHTPVSFGAVYEHRDCFGKPKLIGSTGIQVEKQFHLDDKKEEIRQVTGGGREHGASAHVVWAGVGGSGLGEAEMAQVRRAVCDSRANRLQIEKLSSIKPYSRHGY
mmetsp:Transcript_67021/g.119228  ORF Transcript_67021/g.119228 Transcript_67021/m.119228 type:complete len:264 (+) Transcript_67021:131-922(+)